MKGLKTILGIALATTALGGAVVFAAVNKSEQSNIQLAEAGASTSGSLIVKLGNLSKWSQESAKICAYIYGSGKNAWSSIESINSSTALYKVDYTIDFTPTNMIWVRMKSAATAGNWDQKHNQTGDLGWAEATYLQDQWNPSASECSQWTVSAQVRSNQVASFGTKTTLSKIGLNGDGNPEVSGSVSLIKNEEFKILSGDNVWSGYYGRPAALATYFSGGSLESRSDSNPNIKCEVAGTYDFFFDTETKRLWISRQDIVDADGYASYFLSHVGCDATGANLPSGWSDCSTTYSSLSNDAKAFLSTATGNKDGDNIARCVYWYDYAINAHPSLSKFMTRTAGSRSISARINDNVGIIVVVASVAVLSSVGLFFIIRKKKHQ